MSPDPSLSPAPLSPSQYADLSVCVTGPEAIFLPYVDWCGLVGEDVDEDLVGWTVLTEKGTSRLVTFDDEGQTVEHPSNSISYVYSITPVEAP